MKPLQVRLDVLPLYLESKQIISPTFSPQYWSKWLKHNDEKENNEFEQKRNHDENVYWTDAVKNLNDKINEFLKELSSINPKMHNAVIQLLKLKFPDFSEDELMQSNVLNSNAISSEKSLASYPVIQTQRHYFDVCAIFQTLIEEDKMGKKLFGQFKDPLLIQFLSLLEEYKIDGVHLAQAISILTKSLYTDIPCMQKQLNSMEHQIKAIDRNQNYYERECSDMEKRWIGECQKWGIARKEIVTLQDVDEEINRLCTHKWKTICFSMESEFDSKEGNNNAIYEARQYYQNFTSILHGAMEANNDDKNREETILQTLNQILTSANRTGNDSNEESLISSTEFRTKLVQDLHQLRFFLSQRQVEQTKNTSYKSFSPTIPTLSLVQLQACEQKLELVLNKLQSGTLSLLSPLVHNLDYRQHMLASWKMQLNTVYEIKRTIEEGEVKRKIIVERQMKAKSNYELCLKRADDLKMNLEQELQTLLNANGRGVSIITEN